MSKLKLIVVAALVALLAVIGAGWKWGMAKRTLNGPHSYQIAGWSWGDGASSADGASTRSVADNESSGSAGSRTG